MAVSETLVSAVSHGLVVNGVGGFTSAIYALLVPDAKSLLDQEVGSGNLPSNLYDRCHALFIAHLWIVGDPAYGLSSYSAADYSQSTRDPGETAYSYQAKSIIAKWNQQSTPQAQDGVRRADTDMGLMQTDPNTIPEPWDDGTTGQTNPWGIQGSGL